MKPLEQAMTAALDQARTATLVTLDPVENRPITPAAGAAADPSADPVLAEHAREIRQLGNRAKADLIEMGRRLADARVRARGYWLRWLDRELGWNVKAAERLIAFYKFSQAEIFEFDKLSNL